MPRKPFVQKPLLAGQERRDVNVMAHNIDQDLEILEKEGISTASGVIIQLKWIPYPFHLRQKQELEKMFLEVWANAEIRAKLSKGGWIPSYCIYLSDSS